MAMTRRGMLRGLAGATVGLAVMFNANNIDDRKSEFIAATEEIDVGQAIEFSERKIILHCGNDFDPNTLESIKYAVEGLGYHQVEIYRGGPENMVTSYAFGHNFPGRHYDVGNAEQLVKELRGLTNLHSMALSHNAAP